MKKKNIHIIYIIFLILLSSCGNKKINIDFYALGDTSKIDTIELNNCLNKNDLDFRHQCFYKIENGKIVLIDGGVLDFNELKEIYRQIFFESSLGKNFKNKTYRTAHNKNEEKIYLRAGISTNSEISSKGSIGQQKVFLSQYSKKISEIVLLFTTTTGLSFINKAKNKNHLEIRFSDNLKKDIDIIMPFIEKAYKFVFKESDYRLIDKYIGGKGRDVYVIYIYNLANGNTFNTIHIVRIKKGSFPIFSAVLGHFGLAEQEYFKINRSDLRSTLNEDNIAKGFTPLDMLLVALWYYPSVEVGIDKDVFYRKLEKLIFNYQRR